MWEFAVGLFMIQVWPDSLLLVAVYGLVEAAAVAAFGVLVGELVDKCPRLQVTSYTSVTCVVTEVREEYGSLNTTADVVDSLILCGTPCITLLLIFSWLC